MKKGKLWAIVVLCSFFTQQIFAFTGNTIEPESVIRVENIEEKQSEQNHDGDVQNEIIEITVDNEEEQENTQEPEELEYENTQSGTLSQTGSVVEEQNEEILEEVSVQEDELDFLIKFQNPSYLLEKDSILEEYTCDPEKDECKVNITLIDLNGENLGSKYQCRIEYSNGFEIDERCNPTTVIFTETTNVNYIVSLKNTPENQALKSLKFIIVNNNVEEESNLTENENGSGSIVEDLEDIIVSDNDIDGTDTQNNSGSTNQSGSIIDNNIGELPEIIFEVQSGLDYSGTGNIYICKKEDCKINLDVSKSFTGVFNEPDYSCLWNFGSGSFSTQGTEKKCNPGYVDYGTGSHSISVRIFEKNDEGNFNELDIQINNIIGDEVNGIEGGGIQNEDDREENINNDLGTGSITGTGKIVGSGSILSEELIFPEINLEIQSGADFINQNTLKCKKENCKINLDVSKSFTGTFEEKNYKCEWNFSGGIFSESTIYKCNPGYIDYAVGSYMIGIKIFEKENINNYISQEYVLENPKVNLPVSKSGGGGSSSSVKKTDYGKVTQEKDIIIQSGLENNQCNTEKCKINLSYENASYESCNWDFGLIDVNEKYIKTCNPGFIYVQPGIHKINLEVLNDKNNKKYTKELVFSNTYIPEIINISEKNFEIILQGKQVDYKQKIGDKIICLGVDKCNINLDIDTNIKEKLIYNWDLGDGIVSDKQNPSGKWYGTGSYNLGVQILGENINIKKNFQIEVIPKEIEKEKLHLMEQFQEVKKEQESLFYSIKHIKNQNIEFGIYENFENIGQKLQNMKSKKVNISWFEKKNIKERKLKLTRKISKQKKSLKYSGVTFPDANIYILQGDNIIEIMSDNLGKYSYKKTDLIEGNYDLEYYVLDSKGNFYESNKSKPLELTQEYIDAVHKSMKKSKNIAKSKVNKKVYQIKDKSADKQIDEKEIYFSSVSPEIDQKVKTIQEYVFQILLVLLSVIGSFIVFKRYKIL